MAKLEGNCREVFEKSEWVAIATAGPDGPHVVATWGDYLRRLGIDGDVLRVPVGGMRQTEANLNQDPRVELLCGTRQVQGSHGPGGGCSIVGRAEMQTDGPDFMAVKAEFIGGHWKLSHFGHQKCTTILGPQETNREEDTVLTL